MQQPEPRPLLEIELKGFGAGAILLLVLALALIALQIAGLADGINANKNLMIQLIPGLAGLVLAAGAILQGRRRGSLQIFQNRIEGTRPNGLPIAIELAQVHTIDLKPHYAALKDQTGQLLLIQRFPGKAQGGLIWLLSNYCSWGSEVWNHYTGASNTEFAPATRHFLGEQGAPSFGDAGFLLTHENETWYFPVSQTVDIQGLGNGQLRMNQRAASNRETQLQFQPSPDCLPLQQLCGALLASGLPGQTISEHLAEMAENHGGSLVSSTDDQDVFSAECLGFTTMIFS